jgi:hypothetical protein
MSSPYIIKDFRKPEFSLLDSFEIALAT